jgi:hypothetical protein
MRKLVFIIGIAAAIGAVRASCAVADPVRPVGPLLANAIDSLEVTDSVGCYRLGLTGYHWYDWCIGPRWLYPHRRVCRRGRCAYR